ncbi:MAG: tRNA (adenosine(37)-N6)-dimethylallyltransferase MiaA, partial [Rhodoferax sp.]
GLPLSHFHATQNAIKTEAGHVDSTRARALISLEPLERSWLHNRIVQRFDTMLAQGFLDEVRTLRARGDLHPNLPSMRCVGYRQAWEALDAWEAAGAKGALPLADLRELGIIATRQLAKRQITWLRSMPERQVVQADQPDAVQVVLDSIRRLIPAST